MEDPHWQVIRRVLAEAEELGVVQPCGHERRDDEGHGSSSEVRCDRRAALEPSAEDLAQQWKRFAETERPLHDLLVHESQRAIKQSVGHESQDGLIAIAVYMAQRRWSRRHRTGRTTQSIPEVDPLSVNRRFIDHTCRTRTSERSSFQGRRSRAPGSPDSPLEPSSRAGVQSAAGFEPATLGYERARTGSRGADSAL